MLYLLPKLRSDSLLSVPADVMIAGVSLLSLAEVAFGLLALLPADVLIASESLLSVAEVTFGLLALLPADVLIAGESLLSVLPDVTIGPVWLL